MDKYGVPLIVRRGSAADVLPEVAEACCATTCHVIADDVESAIRTAQRAGCSALEAAGVSVRRWDGSLRSAPWSMVGDADAAGKLPCTFPEYASATGGYTPQAPLDAPEEMPFLIEPVASDGVPSLSELIGEAEKLASPAVRAAAARGAEASTALPFEDTAVRLCAEDEARVALASYVSDGAAAFANSRFARASASSIMPSLHCAGHARLLEGGQASEVFALREAATRAFSPALAVGAISAREVRASATAGGASVAPDDGQLWGRSSLGALADMIEWREWFSLLARRSLALHEAGAPATVGGGKASSGDPREAAGTLGFWRWGGQHLTRYMKWDAGEAYDGQTPAILLVHGFAASSEQWERLVFELRKQSRQSQSGGGAEGDALPPIYALDLLGFGCSEKPGLSYTQYVWEAQVVDFAREVMAGQPLVLGGNSIGGGLSAGAAATLGEQCRGLILCNTAGVLKDPLEYGASAAAGTAAVRDSTLRGEHAKPYAPIPLVGQPALDAFGAAIIAALFPRIPSLLDTIYADRPDNADGALAFAIEQGASSPGSANVIGSGYKLATNRPLNEVLDPECGFGGPVLVAQGLNDRVSGPARAQERADVFEGLRPGVTVKRIDGGHCPQDDAPDAVAAAILTFLPKTRTVGA